MSLFSSDDNPTFTEHWNEIEQLREHLTSWLETTRAVPKITGWYWFLPFKGTPYWNCVYFSYQNNKYHFVQDGVSQEITEMIGWWAGPIPTPRLVR